MRNEKIKNQEVTKEDVAKAIEPQEVISKAVAGEAYFTIEEINSQPSTFGVMSEVLAGALALANKEKMTRSQVQSAIENFKKRKV